MSRTRAAVALGAALLLGAPATPAGAHGASTGYVSTVEAVSPRLPGLSVDVIGGDDRLRMRVPAGATVVVLGYEGEPYLRFRRDGVDQNMRSPATYLNRDRFGLTEVPATADAGARPRWRRVATGRTYEWHDHRIHWMNADGPPQGTPGDRRDLMRWTVAGRIDGRPFQVHGTLAQAAGGGGRWWLYAALPAAALAVLAFLGTRVLRRPTGAPRTAPQ